MGDTGGVTLVLGGARSGKSEVAERLAAAAGPDVTYLATGTFFEGGSWAGRVAAHRARRPATWTTVEVPQGGDLGAALLSVEGAGLVDSLGAWTAGLSGYGAGALPAVEGLLGALARRRATGCPTIVVSEEVGLGVHPATEAGGRFRDALGSLNRRVADGADSVLLVVAGRVLTLGEPAGGR